MIEMDDSKKKLRYQSWHRGCKETDDILGPFADEWLPKAADITAYAALLEEDDWDIYRWLTSKQPVAEEHQPMIDEIRAFQLRKIATRS